MGNGIPPIKSDDAGVVRLIHAESSAVYEGSGVLPTPETEMAPRSFYAAELGTLSRPDRKG